MQRIIQTVLSSLCDLKLAIDGTIVMSQYLRESLDAMYDARIPDKWMKVKSFEYRIYMHEQYIYFDNRFILCY